MRTYRLSHPQKAMLQQIADNLHIVIYGVGGRSAVFNSLLARQLIESVDGKLVLTGRGRQALADGFLKE